MAEWKPEKGSLAMVTEGLEGGCFVASIGRGCGQSLLEMENEKFRSIPRKVVPPFSVSGRGVACVLAARKRALVYILDEDEDEISD